MPRHMSVSKTEAAVRDRSKTETRRLGWWTDKNGRRLVVPGDRLTLCRKVMGSPTSSGWPGGTGRPMAEHTVEIVIDVSGFAEAFALAHIRIAALRQRGHRRVVDRAIAEWGAVELSREMRRGERDHRGRIRWLDAEGRRP